MLTAVMIDTNELAVAPWLNKLTFGGVPKMPANLEYGDLLATTSTGDMIYIERKTPTDLLNSIKDKHIFYQAAGMRERSPWSYIVVTGTLRAVGGNVAIDDVVTGWNWRSWQGASLEIQSMGVPIIHCLGDCEYEPTVMNLCNRNHCGEKILQPAIKSREMDWSEILLTSLPGIGIDKATALLGAFDDNPARALAWMTHRKTPFKIPGIAEGLKKATKAALSLGEYEEIFVINTAHYPDVADYLYNTLEIEKELQDERNS